MSTAAATPSSRKLARFLWPAVLVVLLVAMVLDTRFLSSTEVAAINPAEFDARTFTAGEYPKITAAVESKAVDLKEVAAAVAADPDAAGKKYGHVAGTDKYAIPVRFTGEVTEADDAFLTVAVAGLPKDSVVRVALGPAVNGTALRDVTGSIKFADFENQTDYQQVANELKAKTLAEVIGKSAAARGDKASVTGVYVTNTGPENSYLVTPVKIGTAG
jgi:predicted lipoprotein